MKKLKLMRVEGKIYNVLGLNGGYIYLGNPYDVNNGVLKKGVIWEMQPFFDDVPKINYLYFSLARYFKKDVFGNSDFKIKSSELIKFYKKKKFINNLFYLE